MFLRGSPDSLTDLAEMDRIEGEIKAQLRSINAFVYQHRQKGMYHDIDLHDGVKAAEEDSGQ